jgi:RND family efflux transporter MFP subunit
MSVTLTAPRAAPLPLQVPATGHVMAWQEATIGAETEGLRLTGVHVNVGDLVVRGQVLATFNAALVQADVAEAQAAVAVAEAEAREADGNARRAKLLEGSGAMSAQQISQYLAVAAVARARLDAARAAAQRQRVRLSHARVLAPADGIITARTATVGAVVPAGQELFRMIKDGRLEWRARVAVSDLETLAPGQVALVRVPGRAPIRGTLRMVSPDIDTQTHSGQVYVDLPRDSGVRAGTFVTGHVDVGEIPALTLPQTAVLLRDGFHYVMRVGATSNVVAVKVDVGRRIGDRIEITRGLAAADRVIAAGLGFLSEGDTVRVLEASPQAAAVVRHGNPARTHADALARTAP